MVVYKVTLYGNGRSFDRLKNLTGHFVHTEPLNIFALFTRNFEPRAVKLALCVRNTYAREFLTGRKYVRCPMKIALVYICTLYMMSEDWGVVCSRSHSCLIHPLESRVRLTQSEE